MKLFKIQIATIHYSGVRYLPDYTHPNLQIDIDHCLDYANNLLYVTDDPMCLDINENWKADEEGFGVQYMGTDYDAVLTATCKLAEYMMDLPSFQQYI